MTQPTIRSLIEEAQRGCGIPLHRGIGEQVKDCGEGHGVNLELCPKCEMRLSALLAAEKIYNEAMREKENAISVLKKRVELMEAFEKAAASPNIQAFVKEARKIFGIEGSESDFIDKAAVEAAIDDLLSDLEKSRAYNRVTEAIQPGAKRTELLKLATESRIAVLNELKQKLGFSPSDPAAVSS